MKNSEDPGCHYRHISIADDKRSESYLCVYFGMYIGHMCTLAASAPQIVSKATRVVRNESRSIMLGNIDEDKYMRQDVSCKFYSGGT